MRLTGLLAALLLLVGLAAPGRAAADLPCKHLAEIDLPHARVTDVSIENLGPGRACRVEITSRPTRDSDIRIEVWVPIAAAWNGKFVQLGNGGFAGQIPVNELKAMAARGYAAAGTDDGHEAREETDASWALGHPEKVVDLGWRAVKETTDNAKTVIMALKGSGPARSYFTGCSEGGREGLMAAQRFPADFDGIVAGAPPSDATRFLAGAAWTQQALRKSPGSWLGPAQLAALQAAALRQCGGPGGYIHDPMSCRFDPAVTLCRAGADPSHCLSAEQVAAARATYQGPVTPGGQSIYPGYMPGAEAEPGSWGLWITGASPDQAPAAMLGRFASGFYRHMAFEDPRYDYMKLDFGPDFSRVQAKLAPVLDAVNPDLRGFRDHGGKLIQYHGWNDPAVPAMASVLYYEDVRDTMGDVSGFYRLFMAPGMLHCGAGPGPGSVDWLAVLDDWVSGGVAPASLVATTAASAYGPAPEKPEPRRSQRLCAWPAVASPAAEVSASVCIAPGAPPQPPPPRLRLRRR